MSSDSLSNSLTAQHNLYSPNVKVSRLVLLSGANANSRTEFLNSAPILCVVCREGFTEMVSLLLEFNAQVDLTGDDGVPPLAYAAQTGNIVIIRLLLTRRAKVRIFFFLT